MNDNILNENIQASTQPCEETEKKNRRIFRPVKQFIKNQNNMIINSNILIIMICVIIILIGVIINFTEMGQSGEEPVYIGNILIIISIIMIVAVVMTIFQSLSGHRRDMDSIYLEVNEDGLKGITIDERNVLMFFEVPYEQIKSVVYNNRQVSIHLHEDKSFYYSSFCNTREIYSVITSMMKEKNL